jgi:hypothetical protein
MIFTNNRSESAYLAAAWACSEARVAKRDKKCRDIVDDWEDKEFGKIDSQILIPSEAIPEAKMTNLNCFYSKKLPLITAICSVLHT